MIRCIDTGSIGTQSRGNLTSSFEHAFCVACRQDYGSLFLHREELMAKENSENTSAGQHSQNSHENETEEQKQNEPSQRSEDGHKKFDPLKDRRPSENAQDEPTDRRKAS